MRDLPDTAGGGASEGAAGGGASEDAAGDGAGEGAGDGVVMPVGRDAVSAVLDAGWLDTAVTPGLADAEVLGGIAVIEAAQRAIDSARLALVAELDGRGLARADCGLGTRSWLGHRLGWSSPRATRSIATARRLRRELPVVADALAIGRISTEHAELLARLCTPRSAHVVIELQAAFIALTDGVRFEQWASDVRNLLAAADPDGVDPGAVPSSGSMSDAIHGRLHLDLDLDEVRATEFRAAVDAEIERRRLHHGQLRAADPDHQVPTRPELVAEAVAELVARGHAAVDPHRSRTSVTLVIHADEPHEATTDDGVQLSDGTTAVLACDAEVVPVVVDSLGVPLDMGHAVRFFTPAQQRAIRVRDGGCVHPGCDAPARWTHIHHVEHWDLANLRGPTDLTNGASGCGEHHRLWHQPGWWIAADPDRPGRFTITMPTGRRLQSQHHGRSDLGVAPDDG